MFLREKYVCRITGRSNDLPVFCCGAGHLPEFLYPVDSRRLCLLQAEVTSTDSCRTKGSLYTRELSKIYLIFD